MQMLLFAYVGTVKLSLYKAGLLFRMFAIAAGGMLLSASRSEIRDTWG